MGTATIPVTATATRAKQEVFIPNLRGRLLAVSAFPIETTIHDARIFAEVGTILPQHQPEHRQMVLASGYIGSTSAISWTGDIPIDPLEEVYLYLWSSVAAHIICRIKTQD
jgi:hypothetical protein